jgi:hypothetical protein
MDISEVGMSTTSLKILQAARVDDLCSDAERLAAAVKQPTRVQLPRTLRARRLYALWLLARDRNRSKTVAEILE